MDLVLHPTTQDQLAGFLAAPAHAVLLCGPDGIGKTALGRHLISRLLGIEPAKLDSYPHLRIISPEPSGTISIESIRGLQQFLQLKTIGDRPVRRAVLIEHAQGLTTEAQNAFLKLLEEPPADTILVMTVSSPRALLPTIRSRTQTITVHTPTEEQLRPYIQAWAKDEAAGTAGYFLSGGLPGLLHALLADESEHPLIGSVASAKQILQQETFDRLAMIESLSKQKEQARNVVEALERIAETALAQAAHRGDQARVKQWHRIRRHAVEARGNLNASSNTKLTLTNLFLQL